MKLPYRITIKNLHQLSYIILNNCGHTNEGAEVPDILHPKLWSEDFATFMDSMLNSNDIDFTM